MVTGRKANWASRMLQFAVQSFTYTDNFTEQPEGGEGDGQRREREKKICLLISAPAPSSQQRT